MKKALRNMMFMLMAACVCIGMAGCSDKAENMDTVKVDDLENIVVKTAGNDIVIQETSSDEVTASIVGYDGDLLVQNGNTLTIDIPAPSGGVNLSSPETLYIGIPSKGFASLSATSDTGNIKIDAVNVHTISITTQIGNITTIGLHGTADVQTDYGSIQSDLALSNNISGSTDGARYNGTIGEETGISITLYSSMGNIEMK